MSTSLRRDTSCARAACLLLWAALLGACGVLERPEFGRDCTARACDDGYVCLEGRCFALESPAPAAPGTIAGEQRRETRTGLTWVWMPSGSFNYGCEPQDTQCESDEKPARTEQVAGFWMMQTEVTLAAYNQCKMAGVCSNGAGDGSAHPVHSVDWNDSNSFCAWVGGRLPTAVEWEYAAKSGGSRIYPWGDSPPDGTRANCQDCGDPYNGTSPVGSLPAGDTVWGLKDMAGNVWEWTSSRHDSTDVEICGGSWRSDSSVLRGGYRNWDGPVNRRGFIGFRCAQ